MQTETDSKPVIVNSPDPVCGWIKLFHARGVQVTFPLRGAIDTFAAQVDGLFAAGWLANAPGLEEGEETETVGYVCRGQGEGNRGTFEFVLLYTDNEQMHFSFLKCYLDNDDDVRAFEFASKMKLAELPVYVGDNKPERGKSKQVDRFIVPVKQAFKVVFKKNPKHDPAETDIKKKKPARLFVRWQDQRPAQQAATTTAVDDKPDPVQMAFWRDILAAEPTVDAVNDMLPQIKAIEHAPTRVGVWTLVRDTFAAHGILFNSERKCFEFGKAKVGDDIGF